MIYTSNVDFTVLVIKDPQGPLDGHIDSAFVPEGGYAGQLVLLVLS